MKIDDSITAVNDVNSSFTIAATGKAFRILSDSLYSDKIGSIIRELSCNAYDSHIAANKHNVPFEVHLPSNNECWFSITDFGTGITDSDIKEIYTRYFSSTKTQSNEFIGQLGLGSKSPFCYTDEFTVESRVNGTERKYRMYFDKGDIPRVEFLFEKNDVSLVNGLTIKFNVDRNDVSRFNDRAAHIFSWFKVLPTFIGNSKIEIESNLLNQKSNDWFINKNQESAIALMGNVAYPISADSIEDITDVERDLLSMPIVMIYEIGELEISASRENLSYNKKTQKNLKVKCQQIINELRHQYDAEIKKCKTEWEARRFYYSQFGWKSQYRTQLQGIFKNYDLIWKNDIKINTGVKSTDLKNLYTNQYGRYVYYGKAEKSSLKKFDYKNLINFSFLCDDSHLIIFNDCKTGGASRILQWAKTIKNINFTVFNKPEQGDWNDLLDLLGNPPIITTSSMTEVKRLPAVKYNMMAYSGESYYKSIWTNVNIDLSLGGFWIETNNKVPQYNNKNINLRDILRLASTLNLVDEKVTIYSPRGAVKNKISKLDNWVNIIDFIKNIITRSLADKEIFDKLETVNSWESSVRTHFGSKKLHEYDWNLRDKNGLMSVAIETSKNLYQTTISYDLPKLKIKKDLAILLNVTVPSGTVDKNILDLILEIRKRYSMINLIDYRKWDHDFHEINRYIDIVDANYVFYTLSDPIIENS